MNTPTHLLISAAVLARSPDNPVKPERGHYLVILLGGLVPDLAIFFMFAWERLIMGVSETGLWRDVYWQEPWQSPVTLGNSAPLYGLIVLGGILYRKTLAIVFGLAAFLHILFDFPFHHDDAHAHFWPFSNWRFHSPISYWDADHYGTYVSLVEFVLAMCLIYILWRRFRMLWVRILLGFAAFTYFAVPTYFSMMIE